MRRTLLTLVDISLVDLSGKQQFLFQETTFAILAFLLSGQCISLCLDDNQRDILCIVVDTLAETRSAIEPRVLAQFVNLVA